MATRHRSLSPTAKRSLAGVAVWDTAWKVAAVFVAVNRGQRKWIAPLIVVNSAGILPMLYIFLLSRRQTS